MSHSENIKRLYTTVLSNHKREFNVQDREIKEGARNLGIAYLPEKNWKYELESKAVDFNKAGHRCAYLFKYAMLHTGLICDVLEHSLSIYSITQVLGFKDPLNVCSLGSGPGTDIVALLLVLEHKFDVKRCKITLVDCSIQWQEVFKTTLSQMGSLSTLRLSDMVYEYLGCDLLKFQDSSVQKAIRKADFITMVKFLSAAACKDTKNMVKKICSNMKPGALLFFIDNAAGGFYEIMEEQANHHGLYSVYGPYRHGEYEEPLFKVQWANIISQYYTKVTVAVWKKSDDGFTVKQCAESGTECFSETHRNMNYIKQVFDEHDGIFTPEGSIYEAEYCYERDSQSDVKRLPLPSENDPDPKKDSGWCTLI